MKSILYVFMLIVCTSATFGITDKKLYPFKKGNLWGYLGNKGDVVINPQYVVAQEFSDGVAAVRVEERYGYINAKGEFIIKAQYDIANSFFDGIAKVYVNGKPYIINKKGVVLFEHNFSAIGDFFNRTYSVVTTRSDKQGIINRKGRLIADTIYSRISEFQNGLAVVYVTQKDNKSETNLCNESVIDTSGNMIFPIGKYKYMQICKNGFIKITDTNRTEKGYDYEVITKEGEKVHTFYHDNYTLDYSNVFRNGIGIINGRGYRSEKLPFEGAISSNGKILFKSSMWKEITYFENERAFARDTNNMWYLIDKFGNKIVKEGYRRVLYSSITDREQYLFYNGIAFVQNADGWCGIDSNGIVKTIIFNKTMMGNVKLREKDFIIMARNFSGDEMYYGFWNVKSNKMSKIVYNNISFKNESENVITVWYKDKIGYCNTNGDIIYQDSSEAEENKVLDIDFMMRGYNYTSSDHKEGLDGFGGWGQSDNKSKEIVNKSLLNNSGLKLIIDTTQETKWNKVYKGYNLFVVNSTDDTLYFDAQDSRIDLVLQAKDNKGEWKDIEYLPSSWCGNSYHTLFLAPKQLWEFSIPKYEGHIRTSIRAKLFYKKELYLEEVKENTEQPDIYSTGNVKLEDRDSLNAYVIKGTRKVLTKRRDKSKESIVVIYSNEIAGYINPGQFWYKRGYTPRSIMDPYNE